MPEKNGEDLYDQFVNLMRQENLEGVKYFIQQHFIGNKEETFCSESDLLSEAVTLPTKDFLVYLLEESSLTFDQEALDNAMSSQLGCIDSAQLLLDRGADVNAVGDYGNTSLVSAAQEDHVKIVEYLLSRGARHDIEGLNHFVGEESWFPLHAASSGGSLEVVNVLLGNGANIDAINKRGNTAIIEAARQGHAEIVDRLLEVGASVEGDIGKRGKMVLREELRNAFESEQKIQAGMHMENTIYAERVALLYNLLDRKSQLTDKSKESFRKVCGRNSSFQEKFLNHLNHLLDDQRATRDARHDSIVESFSNMQIREEEKKVTAEEERKVRMQEEDPEVQRALYASYEELRNQRAAEGGDPKEKMDLENAILESRIEANERHLRDSQQPAPSTTRANVNPVRSFVVEAKGGVEESKGGDSR